MTAIIHLHLILPHILLTTLGSLGDLYPYLAVGRALRERGARVTVATSEMYREKVVADGFGFHAIRPDFRAWEDPEVMRRAFHPLTGGNYILRHMLLPHLEESFEDLLLAARDADLLVGHIISFATPIVADVLGKPWISVLLQPVSLPSAYEPPTVSGVPFIENFRGLGPWFWKALIGVGITGMKRWGGGVNRIRRRNGLPALSNPLFQGMRSPYGIHGWFSSAMARRQPDWPAGFAMTGFPFYEEAGKELSPELLRFLDAGSPPVVFTLGSSAVYDAGPFYRESIEAIERVGCRAVLLIGRDPRNLPARPLPPSIVTAEYAPHRALFARAAATVHQGGIGTTAQGLRAGKPMIVVPYSHDQPDNARRIVNMGVGLTIARNKYRAPVAVEAIKELLTNPRFLEAAESVAAAIAAEDGAGKAADLLLQSVP